MESNKEKKVVLITGCSSGFGRMAALRFQEKGWQVIATMRRPEAEKELNLLPNVWVIRLDVSDDESVQEAIRASVERFGRIDVLVNNAGYGAFGFLEEASEEEIRHQMDVNFFGTLRCIRAVLPHMRRQGEGVIINISSLAGSIGMPFASLYNASKFAVQGLSEGLQYELEPFGIKVKVVAPGGFKTNFFKAVNFTKGNAKADLAPYREKVEAFLNKVINDPPKPFSFGDPREVVDVIYKCATQDTPVVNYVGKDAKAMMRIVRWLGKSTAFKLLRRFSMPKFS